MRAFCNQSAWNKYLICISYYHYHYYQVELSQYDHKVLQQSLPRQLRATSVITELLLRE